MYSETLRPGSWPPSPGLAPCAILICSISALARYSAVTPKRPEATCLIFDLSESPSSQRDVDLDAALAEPRLQRFARLDRRVAAAVLAALAGVRLAADAVHRDRERGVRLGRDRAERHRAGGEALDDLGGGLDLLDRHRLAAVEAELEQAAERHVAPRLVVDERGVFLVGRVGVGARRVLQLGDRVRRPRVLLAAHAPGVLAAGVEHVLRAPDRPRRRRRGARGSPPRRPRTRRCPRRCDAVPVKYLSTSERARPDRLEHLRAGVGHVGRDAHLRHHLLQALADRLDVVLDRLGLAVGPREAAGEQRLEREVRMHRLRAVAAEQREMVHFARAAGLDHEAGRGAQPLADQVLVDRRQGQQRRNRDALLVDQAVRDHDDRVARAHRVLGLRGERGEARLDRLLAPGHRVGDVELAGLELAAGVALDVPDLLHLVEVEHRLADLQAQRRVELVDAEQVRLRPDERHQRHHQLFADRVDRRVGDLREELLEVVVERLVLVRQHRERRVVAHRADRLLAARRHRLHDELQVFLGVAEGLLAVEQRHARLQRRRLLGVDARRA